jgi:hypothetical protein
MATARPISPAWTTENATREAGAEPSANRQPGRSEARERAAVGEARPLAKPEAGPGGPARCSGAVRRCRRAPRTVHRRTHRIAGTSVRLLPLVRLHSDRLHPASGTGRRAISTARRGEASAPTAHETSRAAAEATRSPTSSRISAPRGRVEPVLAQALERKQPEPGAGKAVRAAMERASRVARAPPAPSPRAGPPGPASAVRASPHL